MDVKRAQEILNAAEKIDVQYNGELVWIDSVDEQNRTATVRSEEQPNPTPETVPVELLEELQ